jgi:hypothetical protein
MKVEKTGTRSPGLRSIDGRPSAGRPLTFSEAVGAVAREGELRLETIGQELDEQAKRFAKSPTMEQLTQYKELVANFVATAVRRLYQVIKTTGFQGAGRHRVYSIVQKIDESLEELTKSILAEQTDEISLMAKLDEIRGMVLDLYS